jgi:hypothetical protein
VPPSSASSAASAASTLLVSPTPAQAVAHSTSQPTHTGHGVVRPPVIPNPPHEGEVRYYENLRDIQNMYVPPVALVFFWPHTARDCRCPQHPHC